MKQPLWGVAKKRTISLLAALAAVAATTAHASETITYVYDAKGRLVQVVHSGTANNGMVAQYSHDKADNRTNVKVTGAPSSP